MNAHYCTDTVSITQAATRTVDLSGSCLLISSIHHLFLSPVGLSTDYNLNFLLFFIVYVIIWTTA